MRPSGDLDASDEPSTVGRRGRETAVRSRRPQPRPPRLLLRARRPHCAAYERSHVASSRWKEATTSSSSAPVQPACAQPSQPSTQGWTLPSSRRSIHLPTRARPRAGSTRRSETPEDDPEKHAFDTVKGSDYLGDQDAIEALCNEAPGDVYELENWGAVFSRTEDGRDRPAAFGAAGEPAPPTRPTSRGTCSCTSSTSR